MSLSFLGKKKFHPGKVSNREKVKQAELKYSQLQQKITERNKKMREEEESELLKIKDKNINKNKLSFMYDVPKFKEKTDYLLGKKLEDNKDEVVVPEKKSDQWNLIHDDPLTLIKKAEENKRNKIKENKDIMNNLIDEIYNQYKEKKDLKIDNKLKQSQVIKSSKFNNPKKYFHYNHNNQHTNYYKYNKNKEL